MADDKKPTKDEIVKSQNSYKGNDLFELVDIEIKKDGNHYKKGDTDKVHPTLAAILKAKGLIAIAVILMFSCSVKAQTAFSYTASNPTGAILNTSADTLSISLSKSYSVVSIQPVITKATGTMAGTAILAYSVNGTNYVNTDTLTTTNVATNTTVWNKVSAARYWRIIRSGATTVTGTSAAKLSVTQ